MTYTDVTEARTREAELARSEENFRHRFRNLPLPQWVYSKETLRFLEVNDAALAKYGYTQEEFLAMTLKDILPPEDVDKLMYWLAPERIASSPHDRVAAPLQGRTDPRRRCLWPRRRFQRRAGADHPDHRQHGAARQAERQTERIIETSQDLIHVTDSYGKFVRISPSATAVLGYQPEECWAAAPTSSSIPKTSRRCAARCGRRDRAATAAASGAATTTRTATWCRCCGRACGRSATAATISSAAT